MSVSNFIKNNFIGKELCIFLGNEAETIIYDQSWATNKEFLRGIVKNIEDEILILNIEDCGVIYINCEQIQTFWEPPINYYKAIELSLTKKMVGIRY